MLLKDLYFIYIILAELFPDNYYFSAEDDKRKVLFLALLTTLALICILDFKYSLALLLYLTLPMAKEIMLESVSSSV